MLDFQFQSGANGVFGVSAVRVVVKVSDIEGESVSRVTTALVAPRRRSLATSTSLVVRTCTINYKACMVDRRAECIVLHRCFALMLLAT